MVKLRNVLKRVEGSETSEGKKMCSMAAHLALELDVQQKTAEQDEGFECEENRVFLKGSH